MEVLLMDAQGIIRRVKNTRRRRLPLEEARSLIRRCGSYAAALKFLRP